MVTAYELGVMESDEDGWVSDPSSGVAGADSGSTGWGSGEGRSEAGEEAVWEGSEEDFEDEDDGADECWTDNCVGRRGVQYYKRRWRLPIYQGADMTVGEAVFTYLSKKVEDCEGDTASDRAYRLLHDVVLPKPNLFPPSLYVLRKLAGVEDLDSYELHVCREDHYVWDHVPRREWEGHKDDECPVCEVQGRSSKRFRVLPGNRLQPTKVGVSPIA